MGPLLPVFLAAQSLLTSVAPSGATLHVRLTAPLGSYASRQHSRVDAVLIASVKDGGETILPAGSILTGEIKSVQRVGFGVLHETASLQLAFNSITVPGGDAEPLTARLTAVDSGREVVTPKGTIQETRSTGSVGNRAAQYIRKLLLWDVHSMLAVWAVKAIVIQVPEPEIYFPTGTELTLTLSDPVGVNRGDNPSDEPAGFTPEERDSLNPILSYLPRRTSASGSERPSDLINVVLIGSRERIAAAFTAAGWVEPRPVSTRAAFAGAWAVVRNSPYPNAPMSALLLNDAKADMSWQKGFNDVSKRHHVRFWKQAETWQGEDVWIGAATRDVDFSFMRGGTFMTHKIAAQVDHERDKIAADIAFATCADTVDWWDRPEVPSHLKNGTGDSMETDQRLIVVRLNACDSPRKIENALDQDTLPINGSIWQRMLRRQIICLRSDLIRGNPYWRTWEGMRTVISLIRSYRQPPDPDAPQPTTLADRWIPERVSSAVSYR
jgi:hypothetical protein